jgi:hypothetical protein
MREGALFNFIADTMQRKFRFLAILVVIGLAGILYAHGLTWTTALFTVAFVLALGFGWAAISFWAWVFRNAGRRGEQR